MKTVFRYNRQRKTARRPPSGFGRWLGFWLRALVLRRPSAARGAPLLWAEDRSAELLAAGFPSLLAVPGELFADTAALFPDRFRLRAEGSEEELLAAIRRIEARAGKRFDWDAFLAACERSNRLAGALRSPGEALCALAPPVIDTRSPLTALRSFLRKEDSKR